MNRPACTADACGQGKRPCPCPTACLVSETEMPPGLLTSRAFWIGGLLSVAIWTGIAYLAGWV